MHRQGNLKLRVGSYHSVLNDGSHKMDQQLSSADRNSQLLLSKTNECCYATGIGGHEGGFRGN